MKPLKRSQSKLERELQAEMIKKLKAEGWHVEVTHGSLYMRGWPDLYAIHRRYGYRWIEMKRPGEGRLKGSQIKKFTTWSKYRIGVWVLTGPNDYHMLFKPANWHAWMVSDLRRADGRR